MSKTEIGRSQIRQGLETIVSGSKIVLDTVGAVKGFQAVKEFRLMLSGNSGSRKTSFNYIAR